MSKRTKLSFLLFLFLSSLIREEVLASSTTSHPPWQELVSYAQDYLPREGWLVAQPDGYTYVKVDDAYIHTLFPLLGLAEEGFEKPSYFRTSDSPGAHISVFYADEGITLEEVGQRISFEPREIVRVPFSPTTSYVVLRVDAPHLEQLRQKYGLAPKLHNEEYHITLAKKVTIGNKIRPLTRNHLNNGFHPIRTAI